MREEKARKRPIFSIWQVKWLWVIGAIILVGSIMSFGIVGSLFQQLDRDNAIAMVYILVPMLLFFGLAMHILVNSINRRMLKLVNGINKVSDGDLDYRIDTKNSGEYRVLYERFNNMAEELSQTKAQMDMFVNSFAHEFKTPITSINGFADYLYETGKEIESPERLEYLKVISEQSSRLCTLSQDTLLLTKINALQIVPDKRRFSVGEQIRKCLIMMEKSFNAKDITVNIPEDSDPMVLANMDLCEHIWINLINNAVKFTPEGGTISIDFRSEPGALTVSITDTGCGMDEQTLEHVFDKYYQNDRTSTIRGNGIGLAIAKRAAELNEAKISVESEIGKGSKFTVRFKS